MSYGIPKYVKVFTGIITQAGTNPPTVREKANGIGEIVFTRTGVGEYLATTVGLYTVNETVCDVCASSGLVNVYVSNANQIYISTYNTSNIPTDGLLTNALIEIRVYEAETITPTP